MRTTPIPGHWHVTRSWGDREDLEVSPPLTRAESARLLRLLVQETGGEYRDREGAKAQAYLGGRYLFFHRWPCDGQACAPGWRLETLTPA
jgi:hypothetical protein